MDKKEYELDLAGQKLSVEFNNLADQANGSVMVRMGDTVILATAVISKYPKDNIDFFPLTVDFEEKFYAVGKILGGRFNKREGRPTEEAILSGRIVDRTIRPLFEQHIRHEVQVIITVLSLGEYDPDVLAVIGASLALGTSKVPWNGPVSAVRIGKNQDDSRLKVNPTYKEREENSIADILCCGKENSINMIEVGALEIKEGELAEAFELALTEINKLQEFQKNIIKEIGQEKMLVEKAEFPKELTEVFDKHIKEKMSEYLFSGSKEKISELGEIWIETFVKEAPGIDINLAKEYYEEKTNELIHKEAIEKEKRADGRKLDEIRPIFAKAGGISPILHGSGIFYRGGTHVFSALTLGGPSDSQIIDAMEFQSQKRFMHHYNFPPFSTGETGRVGGFNRRMIGHGALAEKALSAVLPSKEDFPYTIRLVSECFASNGSTSMASVCAGTLALMDGGVPIKRPVAGIAVGLMMENEEKYKILTDIQGPEDHHGDMDFKVAGTREGITAVQMDVKVHGVPLKILIEALQKGKEARLQILDKIESEIIKPREKISPNAPEIVIVKIKPDQIGLVIGSGGKTINQIREATETEIDIEDDGSVFITGKNGGAEKAAIIVREMTKEYKAGEKYIGEITKIVEFGAFVKIGVNAEGLLHISEIAPTRIERIEKVLSLGEKIPVIIKEIDERDRIKLSLKEADPDFIKNKLSNNDSRKPEMDTRRK